MTIERKRLTEIEGAGMNLATGEVVEAADQQRATQSPPSRAGRGQAGRGRSAIASEQSEQPGTDANANPAE